MSENPQNRQYTPLLATVILVVLAASAIYFIATKTNFSRLWTSQKPIVSSDFEAALHPFPATTGVKITSQTNLGITDSIIKISTQIKKVNGAVPHSGIALSDGNTPYASGLQEKKGDTYEYSIYLLGKLPSGVAEKTVVRYIFLNLFFDSFASDSYANPENRRLAFREWMQQQKNYDEIDAMINKAVSQ